MVKCNRCKGKKLYIKGGFMANKKEKDFKISLLMDFYGDMLTEKQREATKLYYFDDLSLGEIADITGITRQGVRDSIKRAENYLYEAEEKIGLAKKLYDVQKAVESIKTGMYNIDFFNRKFSNRPEINNEIQSILQIIESIESDNEE